MSGEVVGDVDGMVGVCGLCDYCTEAQAGWEAGCGGGKWGRDCSAHAVALNVVGLTARN